MSSFRFKHFEVTNERSSMKVNTDGVLLGAWATVLPSDRHMIDVGTGTGCIGLMIAQRRDSLQPDDSWEALGIDIDSASAQEASLNFKRSKWSEHLHAREIALQDMNDSGPWDLIVSNPPYFGNSLNAPELRRSMARHTEVERSLSYRDLAVFASSHLAPEGRLSIILPADQETAVLRCMRSFSLTPTRICRISSTARKKPSRILLETTGPGSGGRPLMEETMLTIKDEDSYTEEYLSLVRDFYLFI